MCHALAEVESSFRDELGNTKGLALRSSLIFKGGMVMTLCVMVIGLGYLPTLHNNYSGRCRALSQLDSVPRLPLEA